MLYPFLFHPIFKERVWGGRRLAELYQKPLPPGTPIGECWEVSDRPGDVSVIANGPLAGRDLRWLMENHAADLLGAASPQAGRFPLLVKVLDAREKLSLQVHPPAQVAAVLGGEPKTEMWYIADATPGAELYAGLRRGVSRRQFEEKIQAGSVAECFHRLSVRPGDAMFLPSGRVHAIGAGLIIFEIQQNSDTTYRVFDWNRLGLDGQARPLHIRQSLASINFDDFEPSLAPREWQSQVSSDCRSRILANDPLFKVELFEAKLPQSLPLNNNGFKIVALLEGRLAATQGSTSLHLQRGQFCLIPAACQPCQLAIEDSCSFLLVQPGAP